MGLQVRDVPPPLPDKMLPTKGKPDAFSKDIWKLNIHKRVSLQSNLLGNGRWRRVGRGGWKRKRFFGSFLAYPRKIISALQVSLAKTIIQFVHPSSKKEHDRVLSVTALLES